MCSIDPELARELEKNEYWLWNDAIRTIKDDTEELIEGKAKLMKYCPTIHGITQVNTTLS